MSLQRALSIFDDDTLISLANKGLLRRAGKVIEAGKAAVMRVDAGKAEVVVEGETVELNVDGPRASTCSCPAQGICQHILAAVVLMREGAGAEINDGLDPMTELLAFDPIRLRKWAGIAALRAATEMIGEVKAEHSGAALVISVEGLPQVRWLAGKGLDGVVCKAPEAKRKTYIATALLSLWGKHEVTLPDDFLGTSTSEASKATTEIDPAYLREVQRSLEDAARTALATAPQTLEERLFVLSVSGRADAMPRLAAMLRRLSRLVVLARQHHIDSDEEELLSAIASSYALTLALQAAPSDLFLRGEARRKYENAGTLDLIGFGAHSWRTQSDARGVTGYFFDSHHEAWRTASLSRIGPSDTQFDPITAYDNQMLWSAGPLAKLSKSRLTLADAQVSGERLSLSQSSKATMQDIVYDFERDDDMPAFFCDWEEARAALSTRDLISLKSVTPDRTPILLKPSTFDRPFFDDASQEAIWPVADVTGRWLALANSATEDGAKRLDAIEFHLGTVTPRYVLATARADGPYWRFTPYALILERENQLTLINLDFDDVRQKTRKRWWWSHLNLSKPKHGFNACPRFTRNIWRRASDRLISEAFDLAIATAQLGTSVTEENAAAIKKLSIRLEIAGLGMLADLSAPLAATGTVDPKLLLALSYCLSQLRRKQRTMPYLTFVAE